MSTKRFLTGLVLVLLLGAGQLGAQEQKLSIPPIERGQKVFTCGNSFHWYVPPILKDLAEKAGIQGHEIVGISKIGGSRAIQHWDIPDDKNEAKAALRDGKVDVLTLACMAPPDEGIEKFSTLGLQFNPDIRVVLQEFWIPWDKMEWPFKGDQSAVNPDLATAAFLEDLHAPYFKMMDEYVIALNKQLGRQVVFVAPVGQCVVMLREKIIAGEIPAIKTQSELFTDKLGHPQPPIQAMAAYCNFAIIYHRSPIGLPLPEILKDPRHPEWDEALNRQLQEIAWKCLLAQPLSGLHL